MAKNWANKTKDTLQEISSDGLKPVGGRAELEPIAFYYNYTTPKNPNPKSRLLAKGSEILGVYEGSFVTNREASDKGLEKPAYIHKVRTTEGIVGVSGSGKLNKNILQVKEGAQVKLVYLGKEKINSGPYAGKGAHDFVVRASELKS